MLRTLATRIAAHATLARIILYASLYACTLGLIAYLSYKITGGNRTFRVIELEPVWHPGEVHDYFTTLNDTARTYVKYILLVDVLNIIFYTMMFATLIAWLYKKNISTDHVRMLRCLAPFVMAALDIIENLLIYITMNGGNMNTAAALNAVIIAKLAAGTMCGIIVITGIFSAIRNRK
jgi:hypothetical protein